MKKVVRFLLIALLLSTARLYAGDVVYTLWEDDKEQFWVSIQNDTDHTVRVDSILIVFYNAKGKPIEQRNVPCKGDCSLAPRDTRDFGPYSAPPNTDSARVRNVRYSVE